MTTLWWTLSILIMLIGLVGTVVPLLPGTTLILAGVVLHRLTLGAEQSVGWWTIGGLVVLTILSYVVDFVSGAVGAKYFGATRWGAIGGIAGAVVGLFFGLIGIFIGPVVGVLVGEILGGKELLPAGKSSIGTVLGTTAGLAVRLFIAVVMVAWFFLAAAPWGQ